jgi:N-methylhydantoinase A/oxoprolinase/acetone carboxylase beta subunit
MVVGIDVGGTNTDAAIVGEEISTVKLPNELGLGSVLKKLSEVADLKNEKLIVSTSLPLNLILSKYYEIPTFVLLVPGCGLKYDGNVVKGFVNHRGDVVEDLDEKEVEEIIKNANADNLAIATKFSVRNPELERRLFDVARKHFDERAIALSHHVGELNFPLRVNTTVVNAKIMKTVHELADLIKNSLKISFSTRATAE